MFLRVSDNDVQMFASQSEDAMGVQCGYDPENETHYLILGAQVAISTEDLVKSKRRRSVRSPVPPWLGESSHTKKWANATLDECIEAFYSWLELLDDAQSLEHSSLSSSFLGLSVGNLPNVPRPPAYPPGVYGHVPFPGKVQANDRFCRYEPWPVSRRIDVSNGTIAPQTFAAPISEAQFIACGFGAVARFACPSLLPACFKWEFEVRAGTRLKCGAAIPLYGQAGGGVEVVFTTQPRNSKGIPCLNATQVRIPAI